MLGLSRSTGTWINGNNLHSFGCSLLPSKNEVVQPSCPHDNISHQHRHHPVSLNADHPREDYAMSRNTTIRAQTEQKVARNDLDMCSFLRLNTVCQTSTENNPPAIQEVQEAR